MATSGTKSIPGTLVDSERNIGSGMPTEVEKHANNSSIVESTRSWGSLCIIEKRTGLSRSADGSGITTAQANSLNNPLG
jgi:hypothetical protein